MFKIWLLRVGEVLPCDESTPRLFRMGMIADILSKRGHKVVWWSSTLNHFTKKFRSLQDQDIQVSENLKLKLIHSCGYARNMSLRRLRHQYIEKHKFGRLAARLHKPDIILASMPTIELAHAAVRYARKAGIPVIVDIRDTFPDMYVDFCSDKLRPFMRVFIIPYQIELSVALRGATGIFATSEAFLNWGLGYAHRSRNQYDDVYHVSYPDPKEAVGEDDRAFWRAQGLTGDEFICCFFGQFGFTVDIDTVLEAARLIKPRNPSVRIVLCGVGEKMDEFKERVRDIGNVLFPGWVDRKQISALGEISSAGLMSYRPGKNYEWSMPNKFCEYLALGLAILLQPAGVMKTMIEQNHCGLHYENARQLVDAVLYLADHPDELREMKENARALYEQSFNAKHVYGKLADRLEETAYAFQMKEVDTYAL